MFALIFNPEGKQIDLGDLDRNNIGYKVYDDTTGITRILHRNRKFDTIVTINGNYDYSEFNALPYYIRRKWIDVPSERGISGDDIVECFSGALHEDFNEEVKCFSVFTPTFNSDLPKIDRLYASLCRQTYNEWEWCVVDDSPNGEVADYIDNVIADVRVSAMRNVSHRGCIGFNKHMAAMMCSGYFLCEVDHDDELSPDCFETILKANRAYPDSDFFYSYCIEAAGEEPVIYSDGWGYGYGSTVTMDTFLGEKTFSATPDINAVTIRTIYSQPNHIRVWKKDFYHRIGGHDMYLSVLDDQELLIRTFLNGKMCKIPKVLYIQHEGEGERGRDETNAQSRRFDEIQRTTWLIKDRYEEKIHERVLSLGHEDPVWVEEANSSALRVVEKKVPPVNYVFDGCLG